MRRKSLEDKIREAGRKFREKELEETADLMSKVVSINRPQKKDKVDNLTSEQVDKLTSEQLSKQVSRQLSKQVNKLTSEQVDNITSEQVNNITSEQVDKLTSEQVGNNFSKNNALNNLRPNQYLLLKYIYFNRPFKVFGKNGLSAKLKIKYGTARYILRSLTKKGYIKKPFLINDGVNKGSNCIVNETVCRKLFGPTDIINPIEQVDKLTSEQVDNITSKQVDRLTSEQIPPLNSSSSLLNKTTTKTFSNSDIVSDIEAGLNHPELIYWKKKKLKSAQVKKWMEEFGLPLDDMLESLKHGRFDIVENKIKLIKTPFDYFYGRLKKAGFYHAPKGYISHEQILINREKERLAKIKKEAEELKSIRQEQEKAKIDLEFEKMMEEKGDRFKACESKLNNFELTRRNKKTYYDAMRSAFETLYC